MLYIHTRSCKRLDEGIELYRLLPRMSCAIRTAGRSGGYAAILNADPCS